MVPSAVTLRRCVPAGVALIVTGLYALLSVVRFQRFAVVSWDNAIFEQAVKSYAAGHMPIVDVKAPGFNVLGDHFSPVIAVLAPIYRDRKSTRLNSSHVAISYAVFCLKKKKRRPVHLHEVYLDRLRVKTTFRNNSDNHIC